MTAGFDLNRLWWALALSIVAWCVFLAFSLWVSLWFSDIAGENHRLYWGLCGAYLTLGPALAQLVIRWHRFGVRVLVALGLTFPAGVWGYVK